VVTAAASCAVAFEQQKQQFDKDMRELNDFFEESRRYAQAKAAKAPDFRTNLKLEAMIPVIEGKEPVLVTAVRERAIRDAIAFCGQTEDQDCSVSIRRGLQGNSGNQGA